MKKISQRSESGTFHKTCRKIPLVYKYDTTHGTCIDIFIYFSFTSCVINKDGKTNNKCKQGANRDLNPRKADPLKFSYNTWQMF